MIMKANKQIGLIYKNNESIDKILKDGEVVFERGFLREKTSTTLPITFGGVGKDLKDYKIYGNTVQSKLPSGYTQVDYIESDTNSYIDMGLKGNQNTKIATSALFKNGGTFIGDITDSSQAISLRFSPNNSGAISRFGDNSVTGIFKTYSLNTRYLIETSSSGIKVDNNTIHQWQNITPFETVLNLYLFKNTTASESMLMCLYNCKVYDNDVLVRDFIPCYRNSDNEVGLYDLVNNVFYTNQGTGVFTYGSVVPTPDAPIEMVSYGDRTKNLFDKNNANNLLNNVSINNSTSVISNANGFYTLRIDCKPNTVYTISKVVSSRFIVAYSNNLTYTSGETLLGKVSNNSATNLTITTGENAKTLYVFYSHLSDETTYTLQQILDSIQIEENSTATSYEPYGYKIPVNVRSDNLYVNSNQTYQFTTNNATWRFIDGSTGASGSNVKNTIYKAPVIQGETYNFSVNINASNSIITQLIYDDEVAIKRIDDSNIEYNETFTATKTGYVILRCYVGTNISVSTSNIMLIKSSSKPSKYIPYYNETTNIYLDEPLRKINGYSDYIDFKNGKVVRNIKEYVLDGTRTTDIIVDSSLQNTTRIQYTNNPRGRSNDIDVFCNQLIGKLMWIKDIEGLYVNGISIVLRINKDKVGSNITSTNEYFSINPLILNYILATPTEETIALPNIPTIDGNNTLNIETEITPSQVYIKYKSNE